MKVFTGKVISTKMDKTATVLVERVVIHPVYKKRYKRARKYQVHDEVGVAVGQDVSFVACKPYSKTKRWKIVIDNEKSKKKVKKSSSKKGAKK